MATPEVRGQLDVATGIVGTIWIEPAGPWRRLWLPTGAGAGMEHPFLPGFCRAIAE